jgi:hypothetical protein
METQEIKSLLKAEDPKTQSEKIISDSKNICIIPSKDPEAISSAMALFYTLKELDKNVNLIIEDIPENLKFLSPSLDFISYPKNFVISIPTNVAKISQIYYEKNNEALKVFLTLENGTIKKDNISFYFSETKPDLVITLGIKDYSKELSGRLNPFGFLLDSPILNIDSEDFDKDNEQKNKKFGRINLIGKISIAETVFNLTKNINENSAKCLLTGLVICTDNFKKNITADIFEIASILMKKGSSLEEIKNNFYK